MFLRGDLETMTVSELLQWIELNQKSGTLLLDTKKFWKKLYFKNGRIIFASSNKEGERLGQFLVRLGLVPEEVLQVALRQSRQPDEKRKLSEILVDNGQLSEANLLKCLQELVQEIVYDSFMSEHGSFDFRDGLVPDEVLTGFVISPQALAMEGLRRLDEYRRDKGKLPAEDMFLSLAAPIEQIVAQHGWSGREVSQYIDGHSSAAKVLSQSSLSLSSAQSLLLALLKEGLVVARPLQAPLQPQVVTPSVEVGAPISSMGTVPGAPAEDVVGPPETILLPRYDMANFAQLSVDPEEGFMLSRISGRCSVREALLLAGLGREKGYRILANLIGKGYLEAQPR